MLNNNTNEFIDHTTYEECAVQYKDKKYFFHGLIYWKDTKEYSYDIAIYNGDEYVGLIFDERNQDKDTIMKMAFDKPLFEGKTFWEAEKDMDWIEW